MKNNYSILVTFFFLLLLAGCSENTPANNSEENSTSKNILTMSWPSDIGEANPHLYSPNEMFAQALLYDPLVVYENDGTLSPGLAEKWDVSEDGKEYTFYLRDGVVYSDGSKLTADNVKRNFDTVIGNSLAHSWLEVVTVIDKVEAVDELAVKISLKEAYYPFLQELALIRPLRMLGDAGFPDSGNTADGIKKPIGTGPWILSESNENHTVFIRNENYWGEKPTIEKVEVKYIADSQMRMMALENEEIDLIFGSSQLTPSEFTTLQQNNQYLTEVSEPLSTRILSLNSTYGVTKYKEVRLALQHALDRQTIIDHILSGLEQEAHSLFAPGFPYSDIEIEEYEYDLEKSKQILDDAGWNVDAKTGIRSKDGEKLELLMAYNSSDQVHKTIYEFLQGAWKEIGVDVKLIAEENQVYYARTKAGEYNIVMNDTWGAPYDPHMYIRTMIGEQQIGNYSLIGTDSSDKLTEDITRVIRTTDETERASLYKNIIQTIQQEAILMPISYKQNYLVANDVFKKLNFSPQQFEVPINLYEMK
ncbi:nickel ABC transporter, nickel/metallophore periplasmic binding protein [Lysinibacillus sp. SGAir0095]|nr:nickel ABC transporter, nickel/metallophore periplasmic binding protein [Lysinibacillus sp. SGAir0095]